MQIPQEIRTSLKTLLLDRISGDNIVNYDEFKKYTTEWANLLNLAHTVYATPKL